MLTGNGCRVCLSDSGHVEGTRGRESVAPRLEFIPRRWRSSCWITRAPRPPGGEVIRDSAPFLLDDHADLRMTSPKNRQKKTTEKNGLIGSIEKLIGRCGATKNRGLKPSFLQNCRDSSSAASSVTLCSRQTVYQCQHTVVFSQLSAPKCPPLCPPRHRPLQDRAVSWSFGLSAPAACSTWSDCCTVERWEGEKEKQEAISAAAKLGIHGLVEVTKRDCEGRNEEDWRTEVGVQTEPLRPQEKEGRLGSWRSKEMTDGSTVVWKEMLSDGKKDTWPQTEQLQVNSGPPPPRPAASFETIDMTALQGLEQTDSHPVPPQIPYIHLSLIYPPDENTIRQPSGVGGARRAGMGERRARRPRERRGGRASRGLTQTVDVEDAGVSKLQKLFLQRWGPSRAGQGGGSVGRKLYLKTRELLKSTKSGQRRRGRGKVWDFSQSGDVLPDSKGGGGNTQHRRNAAQQFNQDGLAVGRAQRARPKPTASDSLSSPHIRFQTLSALSPSLQSSPSPSLLSSAASYVPPGSSLLLSTSLPPPAPPPHEQQPEHFDRLLEEVMMGLNILPNNNSAPHSQPPLPTGSSSYASCGDTLVQNKPCDRTTDLLEASPGFPGFTQVVAKARGDVSSNSELPVLQQQCEGQLDEILDHFLQSFEQHVDSCTVRKEAELGGQSGTEASQPYAGLIKYRKNKSNRHSRITELHQSDEGEKPRKTSAPCATPRKNTEEAPVKVKAPAKQRRKRRKNEYLFSLEKERVRKLVSSSDAKTKVDDDLRDKQLQQRPVAKLERCDQWPAKVTLQKRSCLEVMSPAKATTSSSSVNYQHNFLIAKKYPIRSRFTGAHITDSFPFLEEPLLFEPNCSRNEPKTMYTFSVYLMLRVQCHQFSHSLWSPVAQMNNERKIKRDMKKNMLSSHRKKQRELRKREGRGEQSRRR
ncbi:uncharacterized protein LOC117737112 [Cyclopterus lumpus]|uniref:uncharacterized protein LOC117737112 n=1 Tax=Cyclopterus lumpus TaxID=8103 RepID=UPI0014871C37|nr:uncharacterized protein LOC117737112 [Cyclopterus lumpus]